MTESLQENQDLLNSDTQALSSLKREVQYSHKHENKEDEEKESLYKEMIERQGIPISHGDKNNPEISLTFDDGYGKTYIESILDTLKGSGVHATFFLLGECIKNTPNLRKRAIEEGHQICCHTYSHAYLSEGEYTDLFKGHGISVSKRPGLIRAWENNVKRLLGQDYYDDIKSKNPGAPERMNSVDLLETEILMREEEVKKTLGEQYLSEMKRNYPFFRFPGGCGAKRKENIDVLKKHGFLAIGWNGEPIYSMPKTVSNGDIPLFHFNQKNANVLKTYISRTQNSGKNPKLISEIIKP